MGTIIKKYQTIIFAYCFSKVRDEMLAEDFTSETFLRFYLKYFERDLPDNKIKPLLFQIATNLINDYFRQEGRHRSYLSQIAQGQDNNLEKRIGDRFFLGRIEKAILDGEIKLTPTEEKIFKAIYYDHANPTSNAEIQQLTGLEIKKIENSKKTLFRRIRNFFSEDW